MFETLFNICKTYLGKISSKYKNVIVSNRTVQTQFYYILYMYCGLFANVSWESCLFLKVSSGRDIISKAARAISMFVSMRKTRLTCYMWHGRPKVKLKC